MTERSRWTGIGSAVDLISDWLNEGTEDLPDETPVRIEIGKRAVIFDNLGNLRAAEALANAKLIAAAPDLFEALKLVMTWVKNWDPNFTEDEEWFEDRVKIDAAIAKAS